MNMESEWAWTRRTLLRTAAAGVVIGLMQACWPSRAAATQLPPGELPFLNVWTDERLTVTYRNEDGEYDLDALDDDVLLHNIWLKYKDDPSNKKFVTQTKQIDISQDDNLKLMLTITENKDVLEEFKISTSR
mgnify:CR=1 FL=1